MFGLAIFIVHIYYIHSIPECKREGNKVTLIVWLLVYSTTFRSA
jgi:hypothetical protein